MRSGPRTRKTHQTYWEDLMPWINQLYEDHRVYLDIRVHLFADDHDMRPTVEVTAYRVRERGKVDEIRRESAVVRLEDQGHAEALALQLASRYLLDLENEKALAERQTDLWAAVG